MSSEWRLVDGCVFWRSGAAIDVDGSPHAYHPDSKPGLDYLANAGREGNWWALACDAAGVPYVQTKADPAPGFYVSTTSLIDPSFGRRDPRRYVDAERVPYVTCTREMRGAGVHFGDLAAVCYGGRLVAAVVADLGPHPGEISVAAARALEIPSDPRHGGVSHPVVSYAILLGTRAEPVAWPRPLTLDAFEKWGGAVRLAAELQKAS